MRGGAWGSAGTDVNMYYNTATPLPADKRYVITSHKQVHQLVNRSAIGCFVSLYFVKPRSNHTSAYFDLTSIEQVNSLVTPDYDSQNLFYGYLASLEDETGEGYATAGSPLSDIDSISSFKSHWKIVRKQKFFMGAGTKYRFEMNGKSNLTVSDHALEGMDGKEFYYHGYGCIARFQFDYVYQKPVSATAAELRKVNQMVPSGGSLIHERYFWTRHRRGIIASTAGKTTTTSFEYPAITAGNLVHQDANNNDDNPDEFATVH